MRHHRSIRDWGLLAGLLAALGLAAGAAQLSFAAQAGNGPLAAPAGPDAYPGGQPRLGRPAGPLAAPGGPAAASAPAACGSLAVVPSADVGASFNDLYGAQALAPADVWAVGTYSTVFRTLTEHWDGTAWTVIPSPNSPGGYGVLYAVAAVAPGDLWAVGAAGGGQLTQPLVEHGTGSSWTVVPSPPGPTGYGELTGVAAVAANDVWAVGYYNDAARPSVDTSLIEHWDGSSWTVVPGLPLGANSHYLQRVTALAANNVWAVGAQSNGTVYQTLVAHWDGTSWTVVPSPNSGTKNNYLAGVAAVSANDIWAVGDYFNSAGVDQPLAEHWDSGSWTIVPPPIVGTKANYLTGVTAVATNDVWAVGSFISGSVNQPLVAHWDGSAWSLVPSSGQPSGNYLSAATAAGANDIWAVGGYYNGSTLRTLTLHSGPPCTTPTPVATATPTPVPPSPTPCTAGVFRDVQPADYFYTPVTYLASRGVISGYGDCTFRPYNQTTRAQMVKIVVLGFAIPLVTPAGGAYTFADVPPAFPFWAVIETAAAHTIVGGYACGGPGEPCDSANRPYFRPNANVTRGQLSKIVVGAAAWAVLTPAAGTFADVLPGTAFYGFVETAVCHGIISGYSCGGPGEPCDSQNRPYFRPANNAVRGQIAKIVYGALTGTASCSSPTPTPILSGFNTPSPTP
ncbi:MAG TPA: S-layer homology domain-containing protein [Chloroflexia bacterium]|nr:S-layer homology domain-containing protein [Chloroflexia bacterium]